MKRHVYVLQGIASRKGSGRELSFGTPHVLKALQLAGGERFVSRQTLCGELHLGEGAVKTLISHMRDSGLAGSARSGTYLTERGARLFGHFKRIIKGECRVKKSGLFGGRHNHAIALDRYSKRIKSGLEQRDYAVRYGAAGCATMVYGNGRFVFPGEENDCFHDDRAMSEFLQRNLDPGKGDVVIVASADDGFVAEMSAKNAVLCTLAAS